MNRLRKLGARGALVAGVMSWMLMGVQTADAARYTPLYVNGDNLPVTADIEVVVDATYCDNTSSVVTISGTATIARLGMDLRMRNQIKLTNGTKTNYIEGYLDLKLEQPADNVTYPYYPSGIYGYGGYWDYPVSNTPSSGPLSFFIPKQPSQGGVGGNPWIAFDADGRFGTSANPVTLGRCVSGNKWKITGQNFPVEDFADGLVGQGGCLSNQSVLQYDATAGVGDITGSVLFDNNVNKGVHYEDAASVWDFSALDGSDLTRAKGVGQGGVGGNPQVDARFYVFDDWTDLNNNGIIDSAWVNGTLTPEMTRMTPKEISSTGLDPDGPNGNGPWSSAVRCKEMGSLTA